MNVWSGEIHSRVRACWMLFKIFSKVLCDTFWHFYVMIIRKNTPLYGGRGVPSPARKHANVFRSA